LKKQQGNVLAFPWSELKIIPVLVVQGNFKSITIQKYEKI
jgi:hypothetical protein